MLILKIQKKHELARLRRLALDAQGLLLRQPFGRGLDGTRKAINHLGYIQIDTISVVERAHHHVLRSRVPDFRPEMIDHLLADRDIFEYWSHAAAFLPIADFRFSLPYKHAIKSGQVHWYKTRDEKMMGEMLARIRSDGPIQSRDVETKTKKGAGWWDWKPGKKALEQLYMQGDLMVSGREGFQKIYDLTERVLPADINTTMPDIEEFAQHILDQQLRCHALVSLKGLTYLRRNAKLRKAMKALVAERLAQGTLQQLQLSGGEIYYVAPDAFERRLPRISNRLSILSPFDNSVIQRDRLKSLFEYEYQIECYVPAAKRQFGYFCLPLLYRDEFVGRMDCKAHRKTAQLEIKSLHWEAHGFVEEELMAVFEKAIASFRGFQKCDSVVMAT